MTNYHQGPLGTAPNTKYYASYCTAKFFNKALHVILSDVNDDFTDVLVGGNQ